nr:putative hemopexin-like domain-containing protein [Tanacetum cinerariifolium]
MSIPPGSLRRGAAAFLPQPVNENDQRAAQCMVETIYYFNAMCTVTPPLADIEYRSSDGDLDIRRHVFRWDIASYDFVFQHGFEARRQANTRDETYYNLEHYINSGGRPLDTRRDTTHCFISTTISSSWYPKVSSKAVANVFRYEIYAPGGIWVAETLGERYRYPAQDEIAFPVGIAPQYIRSAQLFELESDGYVSHLKLLVLYHY